MTDPSEPAERDAAEPVEPADARYATEPVEPADARYATEPVEPADPAELAQSVQPTAEQIAERQVRVNRSTRGGLAAVLCLEAFCVLLVPRAIAQTATGLGGVKTGVLLGFAGVLVAAAFVQRKRWGIGLGSLLQPVFVAVGVWVHAFFIVGILFLGVWLYLLNLRHEMAGTPGGLRMLIS
jgi:hypothetical protein